MNFSNLHNNREWLLLQCISGSRAYGLDTPESDTDIRGVFLMPQRQFYGLEYIPQVANESNDIVYYELKRFIELLTKNNPNILELLNTPPDSILYKHPVMDMIKPEMFLSRLCLDSFAGYAQSQISKAKGLNKKIFNPVAKEKKSVLDFCTAIISHRSIPFEVWLSQQGFTQDKCGLVKVPNAGELFAVFHESQISGVIFKGIFQGEDSNDVSLSSVPVGIEPLVLMSFNKNGYSMYCKDYREYWDWVNKRNNARYNNTLEHGKNYDSKNMMHTFRLLNMAYEIATEHRINVKRNDMAFLFKIKKGEYQYEDLLKMTDDLMMRIKDAYTQSDLPEKPDELVADELLYTMRRKLYEE